MFKWGLVFAGLADINRPVEKVSLFQSAGKSIFNHILVLISFPLNTNNKSDIQLQIIDLTLPAIYPSIPL